MFDGTRRGLTIAKSSLKTLRRYPKLVVLPILSISSFIAVAVLTFGTMYIGQRAYLAWLLFVVLWSGFLLAATFVTLFFNVALTFCVLDAFAGRDVSLRSGLCAAASRQSPILQWAFFALTVGFIISVFQGLFRRFGILGALMGSAASLSWSIATYFIVPILVIEKLEPQKAVERSAEIVKRNWDTAVGTEAGIGVLAFLALIPPIVLIGYVNYGDLSLATHNLELALAGFGIAVYIIGLIAVFSTVGAIFRTGVYYFAMTGRAPNDLDLSLLLSTLPKA